MAETMAVLGGGSWGIAVAGLLHANGHRVRIWEFNPADCDLLIAQRTHPQKLPMAHLSDDIMITNILAEAVEKADLIILAVPAQKVRLVCGGLGDLGVNHIPMVNLAKGIEIDTLKRMSEVIAEILPGSEKAGMATISGPSHAEEVARDMPTSVVAASLRADFAERLQHLFSNETFRVYRSTDLIGVELGGSLKNVIAIAAGIIQGLGFGDNTLGALITRGQAEIGRVGRRLGADSLTFAGLSGIGDLITTCVSRHSRNRLVGERIGRGETLAEILDSMVMVAEGVDTCRSSHALAGKYGVEMPIADEVYKVLFENKAPAEAVAGLMTRPLKKEVWS